MIFIQGNQYQYIEHPAIGGKAKNLLKLGQLGLHVPKWAVLPADFLAEVFKNVSSIEHTKDVLHAIDRYVFPPVVQAKLNELFADVTYLAVRSSALDEDGRQHSFAGQFESYLYVKKEHVLESIKDVWRSVFSERVLSYRQANHLGPSLGIGVIIQEMIDADAAGVAFGMNPVNGHRKEKLISAVFGVGEGLVSGELEADHYMITNRLIDRQTVRKKQKMVFNPSGAGGTVLIDVPRINQNDQAVSDEILWQLDELLEKLRKSFGLYQDMEFAVKDDNLYILQTRPITGLSKLPDPTSEYIVWDNSNIVESYPGVTTPLTFSFISQSYETAYKIFVSILGVDEQTIHRHQGVFANMLGFINGRVYYNLRSWYHLLAMLPGYSLNARFMEQMMGVKESFDVPESYLLPKGKAWRRILKMLVKMYRHFRTLPKQRIAFKNLLDRTIDKYKRIDFQSKDANELMNLYLHFERTLLHQWKAPLLNDFFAMIWFGLLKKRCEEYTKEKHPNIHNDLLCGSSDIISTQPIHRSVEIATYISDTPYLKQVFLRETSEDIWQFLLYDHLPESKKAKQMVQQYLTDFGERCVGELKLETISYTQDPSRFVQVLKSYVESGITSAKTSNQIEEKLRTDAEAVMKKALRHKPFKKWIFKKTLNRTRDLVSARENLRYERTRGFGIVREIFTYIGKRFYEEDVLEFDRDIFFLSKEEIFAYIEGRSLTTDLKSLVAVRKEEHERFQQMPMPSERIGTYGIVYQSNDFYSKSKIEIAESDLKGIGCCPGQVKARARVVHHPNDIDSLDGDILVTTSTDPGWVTLFPSAGAIIVERGSLLSHSAIVSREMGIPCIVSVTGLLSRVKTGDWIKMDGSTGEIKILDEEQKKHHHG
ncbi:phosphoenolpyruvate synthase [Sphingobacterium phlebotomi]|uniref:Phosphoenolpyruvate synthase n=1 Tax=Sphingobacterium phlebotomi TaxID=2605433 RepID=A0A5D4H3Z0_9SPHI|nr:PEP/pyruvate-binding domain-containing protein [Sphingobacterium phlebotomi]TYR34165.1 phosphoenolpyruvate synthase [Sphingobacterium phlebotomi]